MRKLALLLVSILMLSYSSAQAAPRTQIIAAVPEDFPPTYFKDSSSGQASGYAVELLNEAAAHEGLEVKYVFGKPWDEIEAMLLDGRADVIPAMAITERRLKLFKFSTSIGTVSTAYIVRASDTRIPMPAPGIKIGCNRGGPASEYLVKHPEYTVVPYSGLQTMLFDLLAGRIDAALTPTRHFMKVATDIGVEDKLRVIGPAVHEYTSAMALRADDAELLARLNHGIQSISAKDFERLFVKWWGKPPMFWTSQRVMLITVLVVLAALGAAWSWRYQGIKTLNNSLKATVADLEASTEALRKSRQYLASTFNNAADAIFIHDAKGRITDCNLKACEALGYTRQEIIGMHVSDIDPDFKPLSKEIEGSWQLLAYGSMITVNGTQRRKDGSTFPVEVRISVLEEGDNRQLIAMARDVTERRAAQSALQKSENMLKTIVDAEPECVKLLDRDAGLIFMNRAGLNMIEAESLDMVKGQCVCPIINDDHREAFMALTRRVFEGDSGALAFEVTGLKGRRLWLETHAVPFRDENGVIIALLGITRDITDRREAEQRIQRSLKEKEVLLSEVHHRVKNNMAIISSLLKLQSAYVKDPGDRMMFKESQSRIKSMALVHEKIYQNNVDFTNIDLQDYVRSLMRGVKSMFYDRSNVDVKIDTGALSLGIDTMVPCGLIINELVTNAFKYAFDAEGQYEVAITFERSGRDKVVMTVADNGCGLPQDKGLENPEGMGLKLVEALSLQLGAEVKISREGGTAFRFEFPRSLRGA